MKVGLRFQILLMLGALLSVSFLGLFLAIASSSSLALEQIYVPSARWIGERTAAELVGSKDELTERDLRIQLQQTPLVSAIAVFDSDGTLRTSAGRLPGPLTKAPPAGIQRRGTFLLTTVRNEQRGATVVLPLGPPREGTLHRLLALNMSLVAVVLLIAMHFTLTRWIVRPIGDLSLAAQHVAATPQSLRVDAFGSRELQQLADSFRVMTDRLLQEEKALRNKVSELEAKTHELSQAQGQLVQSERLASVGQLSAGVAHEVGNPLAAISGMLDLIATADLSPEEVQDFVGRMQRETNRIQGIVQDLLQFARPSHGPTTLAPARGSVEAAAHETATLVAPQPLFRNVELALDVHPELPDVKLSQDRLTQVLLNLLMNAGHACKEGGRVTVKAQQDGGFVVLDVCDTGAGVPEDARHRIFEPFVSTKEVGEGTGLGLSVCRSLVEAAGGTLSLEASTGGAHFRARLPLADRLGSQKA